MAVRDDNILTRRKSWNVEFDGEIVATAAGSTLCGSIDVPDRRDLEVLMWALRIVGLVAAVLIVALSPREGLDPGTLALGAIIAAVTWITTVRMRTTGLKRAAEDGALVLRHVRSALGAPLR